MAHVNHIYIYNDVIQPFHISSYEFHELDKLVINSLDIMCIDWKVARTSRYVIERIWC